MEGRSADAGDNNDEIPIIRSGDGVMYADDGTSNIANDRIDYGPNQKPIYHNTDDEHFDTIGGTWVNFFPMASAWTTERNSYGRNNGDNIYIKSRNPNNMPKY